MTTEPVSTTATEADHAVPTSQADLATQSVPADPTSLVCHAESIEIGIGDGEDPFDATFLMAGTDAQGRELALWIRLTPITINDLTSQFDEVLFAQQRILGADGDPIAPADDDPSNQLVRPDVQLEWFRDLGFEQVDNLWRWRELALLHARKPN